MLLVRAFGLGLAGSLAALGTASCRKASCEELGNCENRGISDAGGEPSPTLEPGDAADSSVRPFSCKDFDEATSVCWDFSSEQPKSNLPDFASGISMYPEGRGTASFTSLNVHSRPRAGLASIRKGAGRASAQFYARVGVSWRHVRLSWWTYLATLPATGTWTLGFLQRGDEAGGVYDSISLTAGREQLECSEVLYRGDEDGVWSESGRARLAVTAPIPTKTWTRLALDVALGPANEVRVAVDDVVVATAPLPNGNEVVSRHLVAGVGIAHAEGSTQTEGELVVDDLVLEQLP